MTARRRPASEKANVPLPAMEEDKRFEDEKIGVSEERVLVREFEEE